MRLLDRFLFAVILSFGCNNSATPTSTDSCNNDSVSLSGDKSSIADNAGRSIHELIIADLNGDQKGDTCSYTLTEDGHGWISIHLGGDQEAFILECTDEAGNPYREFRWADSWRILAGHSTTRTYAVDGELRDSVFTLENPAIKLWQDGGGSGFFTFKGGKWIWVTTGC